VVEGHCRSARTLINRKTLSSNQKRHENDQPKRRHDERQNVDTLERHPDQRDVADHEKNSDGHADAPCNPASLFQLGDAHPCVKPIALMRWLCRLITPKAGAVIDPFAGSGVAVLQCGFQFIGCELSQEYAEIAKARLSNASV